MRTHTCGELRKTHKNQNVILCGWIDKIREHGNIIFVDLRDRYGKTQCVFPEKFKEDIRLIKKESTLKVEGKVNLKPEPNKNLKTGDIELQVENFKIFSKADSLPIDLEENSNMEEETKLTWRYLDLRRTKIQSNLILRSKITQITRNYFNNNGFIEIETPILGKSTPEGARDYLVPSRVKTGKFYALPQSPQLFKQLLMVAGFDRYIQIVKCFRDEDLRADRQPEFTQIDLEMSFVDQKDVMDIMENFTKYLWKELLDIKLEKFPILTYQEAMDTYGVDRPDTRFDLHLKNVSDIFKNTEFKIFKECLKNEGIIKAINAKNCSSFSRKGIKELEDLAKVYKAKGLAYLKIEDEVEGPIAKFLEDDIKKELVKSLDAKKGDLLLFVADHPHIANSSLGNIRLFLGNKLNLIEDKYNFLWVTDFPLLEYDEDAKRHIAIHHPFTHPKDEDIKLLDEYPLNVKAKAYDLVLNGTEIAGGSIRIHDLNLQYKIFEKLGISKSEADEKFKFLLNAFKYGAPPHGGMAFGLDRLVSIITKSDSLRDVIAFPKTKNAEDLMLESPGEVAKEQLDELNINIKSI